MLYTSSYIRYVNIYYICIIYRICSIKACMHAFFQSKCCTGEESSRAQGLDVGALSAL